MKIWLKNPLSILAENAENGLVIESGKIIELVPLGTEPTIQIDQIYDASQHVIIPGLINTHHHFYQTLTRACPSAINKELFPLVESALSNLGRIESREFPFGCSCRVG
ncbi:hypothetical protein [Curvivirga aplysinae]|uniref:hypothetical protein n=1 Tax=Curvivirga aplysinae TaxID=2529852 RepID=UPI001C3F5A04|nr:hypothetical protein [Curvivirga aplysinae]